MGWLTITGVDPLARLYQVVRARHGYDVLPEIAPAVEIAAGGEELTRHLAPESFAFAYSCNALDHAADPVAVVREIAACLKPGGVALLEFYTREGTRQEFDQLHQFDLYADCDALWCTARNAAPVPLVAQGVPLRLHNHFEAGAATIAVLVREAG